MEWLFPAQFCPDGCHFHLAGRFPHGLDGEMQCSLHGHEMPCTKCSAKLPSLSPACASLLHTTRLRKHHPRDGWMKALLPLYHPGMRRASLLCRLRESVSLSSTISFRDTRAFPYAEHIQGWILDCAQPHSLLPRPMPSLSPCIRNGFRTEYSETEGRSCSGPYQAVWPVAWHRHFQCLRYPDWAEDCCVHQALPYPDMDGLVPASPGAL